MSVEVKDDGENFRIVTINRSFAGTESEILNADDNGVKVKLPVYSNDNRPPASYFAVGVAIFNSDDNAPNYSDGADWRDALGNLT